MTVLLKKGKMGLMGKVSLLTSSAHLVCSVDSGDHGDILNRAAYSLYPQYAQLHNLCNEVDNSILFSKNKLNVLLATANKTAERNAIKLAMWSEGISKAYGNVPTQIHPVVYAQQRNKKFGGVITIELDRFWWKTPVALDFILTIIGLAPKMHIDESAKDFIVRMARETTPQGKQLSRGLDNGNIDRLLMGTLPCQKRDVNSDWLLHNPRRTFANYYADADGLLPTTEANLQILRVMARKKEELYASL